MTFINLICKSCATLGLIAAFCASSQAFGFLPPLNANAPTPSRATAPKGVAPVLDYLRDFRNLGGRGTNEFGLPPFLLDKLRRGEYEEAIATTKAQLEILNPIRFDECAETDDAKAREGWEFRRYLYVYATSLELNGNWREAERAYAALYGGPRAEECRLALARFYYATGDKSSAFQLLMDDVRKKAGTLSVEETLGRLERGEINESSNRWTGRFAYARAEIVDRDWFELYSFRDDCARVVCPELYFAASGKDCEEAQANFDALRREKYAEFLAFAEAEFARLPEGKAGELSLTSTQQQYGEEMAFLRDLAKLR